MASSDSPVLPSLPPHISNYGGKYQSKGDLYVGNTFNVPKQSAPTKALPQPSDTIPFRRGKNLVQRDVLLSLVARCEKPGERIALVGMGGVGKSCLAIECAYRIREQSPEKWVFWIHGSTRTRFEECYQLIAERVHMQGCDEPGVDILRKVHSWLSASEHGQWFMVVDNVDDGDVIFTGAGQEDTEPQLRSLSEYLPTAEHGSILFTSRNSDIVRKLVDHENDIYSVNVMSKKEAVSLVLNDLTKLTATDKEKQASQLVEYLGYVPLAIVHATGYINRHSPRVSINEYLVRLRSCHSAMTKTQRDWKPQSEWASLWESIKNVVLPGKRSSVSTVPKPDTFSVLQQDKEWLLVLSTWRLSVEAIKKQHSPAANLLGLISMFDRQEIHTDMLVGRYSLGRPQEKLTEEDKVIAASNFERDIHILRAYHLIGISSDGTTFNMHRLVQTATHWWLQDGMIFDRWQLRYLYILNDILSEANEHTRQQTYRRCFPHIETTMDYTPNDEEIVKIWTKTLNRGAWYAFESGWYPTVASMSQKSYNTAKESLGSDNEHTLRCGESLARLNAATGSLSEAIDLQQQILSHRDAEKHPKSMLYSQRNLASMFIKNDCLQEAKSLLLQVVEDGKRVFGEDASFTLNALNKLAKTYLHMGQLDEACRLQEQVYEKQKEQLGIDHSNTRRVSIRLAKTYSDLDRWPEAEELYSLVLNYEKKSFGDSHLDTLTTIENLTQMYLRQGGRLQEAEELCSPSLQRCTQTYGEDHPMTLELMQTFSSIRWRQGRHQEAIDMLTDCLELRKKNPKPDHSIIRKMEKNLANMQKEIPGQEPLVDEDIARGIEIRSSKYVGAD